MAAHKIGEHIRNDNNLKGLRAKMTHWNKWISALLRGSLGINNNKKQ